MKKYVISTIIVLAILVVAWTAFGQDEEGGAERRQQTERGRQRFQNMSEEEREKYRAFVRGGGIWNPEEWQKSIKAIEEQLGKLKAAQMPWPEGGFRDLSEDERTKLREKMGKVLRDQYQALQVITNQVARLQGRSQLKGEGERYLIVSTNELKQIQDMATKEKAKETSDLLGRMIARGSGRGFGRRRPQGGQRGGGSRRGTGQQQ